MEKGEKIMFTFLILFFNYLYYLKALGFSKNHPNTKSSFQGIGCLVSVSIPVDGCLIYLFLNYLANHL